MEMLLGFLVLLACLVIGVRHGGLGLAAVSGVGLIILAQCKTLWDFGFRTYDARLKSMIFRNRYSSSAMP